MRKMAVYNPTLNNYTGDIGNPITVLEKEINIDKNEAKGHHSTISNYNQRNKKANIYLSSRKNNLTNNINQKNLEGFVNFLNQEIAKEIEDQLKNDDFTTKKK